jgi:hypothetical protein
MTREEIIQNLKEMLQMSQDLASLNEPALQGDIQIVLAIIVDKLRSLDPTGTYPHQVEYE